VTFDEDGDHKITVTGTSLDATGLSIELAAGNFASDANVDAAISDLDIAIGEIRNVSATLGSSNSLLQIRLNFTETLINTLEEGSSKLVNADLNEESANLLSLQTRQQLGVTSLSLAQQSEQSVLQLF
jgi:flagellin-like hook-associated protein FlgL